MALSDELAYMTAAELAMRIRRRQLSPVEVVEACIARIEQRNKSLNAFVYFGFDDARSRAKAAEQALLSGSALGPLHGVPTAMKDLFDFKPGWVSTFGGVRALKDNVIDAYCAYAERMEQAGAILLGKTNSPVMGFRGTCDNYLFGPAQILSTSLGTREDRPVAARPPSPMAWYPLPREPMGVVPFVFPPPGAGSMATKPPLAGCPL